MTEKKIIPMYIDYKYILEPTSTKLERSNFEKKMKQYFLEGYVILAEHGISSCIYNNIRLSLGLPNPEYNKNEKLFKQ